MSLLRHNVRSLALQGLDGASSVIDPGTRAPQGLSRPQRPVDGGSMRKLTVLDSIQITDTAFTQRYADI